MFLNILVPLYENLFFIISLTMVYALLSWRRHLHKIWEIVKYEYCTVMKFLILEKQSANNFRERLTNVYEDSAASYATIARWIAELNVAEHH